MQMLQRLIGLSCAKFFGVVKCYVEVLNKVVGLVIWNATVYSCLQLKKERLQIPINLSSAEQASIFS